MSAENTIQALTALNQKQSAQLFALFSHIGNLETVIEKQAVQISALTARVDELEQELSIYKNPKNSGNSHMPPSSDVSAPKRNQSLREKSGRNPADNKATRGIHSK